MEYGLDIIFKGNWQPHEHPKVNALCSRNIDPNRGYGSSKSPEIPSVPDSTFNIGNH